MEDRAQLLIDILFDPTAREDERDDAAMDLGDYPEQRVADALVQVIINPGEDDTIVDSAAESLAEIWVKLEIFDPNVFVKLIPFAQKIVFKYIMAFNPELIPESIRKERLEKYGQ